MAWDGRGGGELGGGVEDACLEIKHVHEDAQACLRLKCEPRLVE
jgi:hypothetical protein